MTALFHYTCQHGRDGIGNQGVAVPSSYLPEVRAKLAGTADDLRKFMGLVWFTDLAAPDRDALGLTMHSITCDRTQYRYIHFGTAGLVQWVHVRKAFSERVRASLEEAPGAMPMHWWVSTGPVPVSFSPIEMEPSCLVAGLLFPEGGAR